MSTSIAQNLCLHLYKQTKKKSVTEKYHFAIFILKVMKVLVGSPVSIMSSFKKLFIQTITDYASNLQQK